MYTVHPSSYIDDDVTIGEGTKIWHFCHVQRGAVIGENCSLGQNVNIGNNVKINLCENKIEFEPEIALEVSCSDVVGDTYSDSASITLCDDTFIKGSVAITPTLHCDGKIENEIDFN